MKDHPCHSLFWEKESVRKKFMNPNLIQLVKMGVSTFHEQNFLSSLLEHFHFVHLQRLQMCSFKQQPCVDLQIQPC
jgi:hypothetical protein